VRYLVELADGTDRWATDILRVTSTMWSVTWEGKGIVAEALYLSDVSAIYSIEDSWVEL